MTLTANTHTDRVSMLTTILTTLLVLTEPYLDCNRHGIREREADNQKGREGNLDEGVQSRAPVPSACQCAVGKPWCVVPF